MMTGLRRSALYVPCDSERMIEKAAGSDADLLLLNLEDGVAEAHKDAARAHAVRALAQIDFGPREKVVRINDPESDAGRRDFESVVPCRPDGICLPKVESPDDVRAADAALRALEGRHGIAIGTIRLHAMIESAAGVLAAQGIAAASARMSSLIFGSADYGADLRCLAGEDRAELMFALQMIVTGARAAAIDAIDAPCFDLRDDTILKREAVQARRLGFDGKSALRPAQLPAINEVFGVSAEELSWAGKVMAELAEAEARGRALSTLDGRLIDNPHRSAAERILERARLANLRR